MLPRICLSVKRSILDAIIEVEALKSSDCNASFGLN